MPLFSPNIILRRVNEITPEFLSEHSIKNLILDIDNTLALHGGAEPAEGVASWLAELVQTGIQACVLSNNNEARVKPFAEAANLPFVFHARKPLRRGYISILLRHGWKKNETACVGDQLFTDVLGANLSGIMSILVKPIEYEPMFFFKVKRFFEKIILMGKVKHWKD